jgi:hypothetical protein
MISAQLPFLNKDGTVAREWFIFLATLNVLVQPNTPPGGTGSLADVSLLAQLDQTSTIDDLAKLKQDLYDAILNRPLEVPAASRQLLQRGDFEPAPRSDRQKLVDFVQLADPPPGSWQAYTPVVTANTGTFTTVSASGRFQRIGKTASFMLEIDIVAVGTAAGTIFATLPVKANASLPSAFQVCSGREVSVTGKAVSGTTGNPDANHIDIVFYDGSFPGASGNKIVLGGSYEAA